MNGKESKSEGERDISATGVVKERRPRYLLAVRPEESGPLDRPFMTGAPARPGYAAGTRRPEKGKNEATKNCVSVAPMVCPFDKI
jgi:hypothetical protein